MEPLGVDVGEPCRGRLRLIPGGEHFDSPAGYARLVAQKEGYRVVRFGPRGGAEGLDAAAARRRLAAEVRAVDAARCVFDDHRMPGPVGDPPLKREFALSRDASFEKGVHFPRRAHKPVPRSGEGRRGDKCQDDRAFHDIHILSKNRQLPRRRRKNHGCTLVHLPVERLCCKIAA